jgi:ribosomal protein L7/L12
MNYYARAIKILSSWCVDQHNMSDLLHTIAAQSPGAIVRAVDGKKEKPKRKQWEEEVLALIPISQAEAEEGTFNEKKVMAIKKCRAATGKSLKDALDAVNTLWGLL